MLRSPAIQIRSRAVTQRRCNRVNPAIVVQIAECCSASGHWNRGADITFFEMSMTIHRQQWWISIFQRAVVCLYVVEDVALHDEGVLPAVVVEVFQPNTPARRHARQRAEASLQFCRAEQSSSFVAEHNIR